MVFFGNTRTVSRQHVVTSVQKSLWSRSPVFVFVSVNLASSGESQKPLKERK